MFKELDGVEARFEAISRDLQDPAITGNQTRYRELMKEYSDLGEIVKTYREYKKTSKDLSDNLELIENESDAELRDMARSELSGLEKEKESLSEKLKVLLLPKDPNDDKNIILELRAGAGGDEASLFAEELYRAYSLYAAANGWQVELLSISEGNAGGFKEVVATISGEKVFSKLKYESGVHRVQRVPKTESQGRIHTSTITVAVLPEADEVDVEINLSDVRIDVYRSSGSGGQHVNKTDSAVRLTHMPSGIVVACQDEKSQIKNKSKAFKILRARLLAAEQEKAIQEASDQRLAQIGTGDRSERIRTYNFPQSRVTDHRIGFTTHALVALMNGKLEEVIDPVSAHFQAEMLKSQTGSH
jgi:peptide chain release factor 1